MEASNTDSAEGDLQESRQLEVTKCALDATNARDAAHAQEPKLQASSSRTRENLLELSLCKICFERPRDIAFPPCGHLGFYNCSECCQTLELCPVCRQTITHKLVVF